jgi:hypothetical protein
MGATIATEAFGEFFARTELQCDLGDLIGFGNRIDDRFVQQIT